MENSTKNKKKKRGFTLVELVIVLAVMGIIALIAIPSLMGTKENFRIKADKKSCETVKRAVGIALLDDDDTIKSGTYYVGWAAGDKTVGTVNPVSGGDAKSAKIITDILKDTNVAQSKDAKFYMINIAGSKESKTVTVSVVINNTTTEALNGIEAK